MKTFISILFWAGIVFLFDGSLGLLFEDKWQKLARGMNIRRLVLVEVVMASVLLVLHFLLAEAP